VDINGLLDREKIYGYNDDTERFTSFQIAVVDWVSAWKHRPDIIHVHDHHTALLPFMLKYCFKYRHLETIPTVLTIHNAQYQGWMDWNLSHYIPNWDGWRWGMLDWNNMINPLAAGIKCAWKVTTVSWSYLYEMRQQSNGLEALLEYEKGKCVGILNGIDSDVWDPATDSYLDDHYTIETLAAGKRANKEALCREFNLNPNKPLFVFIGRLVGEKAADLLPKAIGDSLYYIDQRMNFLVLGSGETHVEQELEHMRSYWVGYYNSKIGYNEKLSHRMYAGADFLLMPSRVEPCGLNQMYAMRYGTVPVVRRTGGLRDTVIDISEPGGYGISFNHATVGDITHGVYRAVELYDDQLKFDGIRRKIMELDFGWDVSAKQYLDLYKSLLP
jgi:starch synthase